MRFHLGLLVVAVLVGTATGRDTMAQGRLQAVDIPREGGLPVVAVQPDCPLQFENVKFLAGVGGGGLTCSLLAFSSVRV